MKDWNGRIAYCFVAALAYARALDEGSLLEQILFFIIFLFIYGGLINIFGIPVFKGIKKDFFLLYSLLANKNYRRALTRINYQTKPVLNGTAGVEEILKKNIETAVKWCRNASEVAAWEWLAEYYVENGRFSEAVRWTKKLEAKDDAPSKGCSETDVESSFILLKAVMDNPIDYHSDMAGLVENFEKHAEDSPMASVALGLMHRNETVSAMCGLEPYSVHAFYRMEKYLFSFASYDYALIEYGLEHEEQQELEALFKITLRPFLEVFGHVSLLKRFDVVQDWDSIKAALNDKEGYSEFREIIEYRFDVPDDLFVNANCIPKFLSFFIKNETKFVLDLFNINNWISDEEDDEKIPQYTGWRSTASATGLNQDGCWRLYAALYDLPRMVPAFWSEFEKDFLNDFLWEIISLKQSDGWLEPCFHFPTHYGRGVQNDEPASYEWLELVISLDIQAERAKKMLREYEN